MATTKQAERQLRKLFRTELTAIMEAGRARGVSFLAGNPDPTLETYYTEPRTRKMTKADFESGGCDGAEKLEAALGKVWADETMQSEFSAMAAKLAKISESLRATEEQSSDVSQFVYVMY